MTVVTTASPRMTSIDGLRGLFLVAMTWSHSANVSRARLGLGLNDHQLLWADAATGFVFMSGLVAGVIHNRRLRGGGSALLRAGVQRTMARLYRYHVATILVAVSIALFAARHGAVPDFLRPFGEHPAAMTAGSLLLVTGVDYLNILPLYILLFPLVPMVLRLADRGLAPAVLFASLSVWALGRTGIGDLAYAGLALLLGRAGVGIELAFFFNLLAWQLFFVAGLLTGHRQATGVALPAWLTGAAGQAMVRIALATLLVLAMLRFAYLRHWLPAAMAQRLQMLGDKSGAGVLVVFSFTLMLITLAWMLGPGRGEPGWLGRLAALVTRLTHWRPLVIIGTCSLAAYTAHAVHIMVLAVLFARQPAGWWTGALVMAAVPLPLLLAWWWERSRQHWFPRLA